MSHTPKDPRDHLLADTLHDDWASGPASAMARRAAASARRRGSLRRGAVALGTAAALVALASVTLRREAPASSTSSPALTLARDSTPSPAPTASASTTLVATTTATFAPVVGPAQTAAAKPSGYEIVSDEEFFALLRDRPLLVLPEGKGAKKFVVLAY